jgi:hypothetical protein
LFHALNNFSDKGAFAPGRTRLQVLLVQAIARAIVSAGLSFLEYRPLIEVGEDVGI